MLTTSPISAQPSTVESKQPNSIASDEVPIWRSLALLAMGGLICIFSWTKPHATLVPQAGVVMHLPGFVDSGRGFVGVSAAVSPAEHYILPKDTEFARKDYSDFHGPTDIFCGIVLSGATDQSIHRPEVCLVAQGWNIVDQEDVPIKMKSGHILTVRNLTIKRTEMIDDKPVTWTEYNMYWFVGREVTTPYHYMRIFLSSWDRIVHDRTNRWAYVTVSSKITKDLYPQGLDAAQTKAMMVDFIRQIVPTFQKTEMANASQS